MIFGGAGSDPRGMSVGPVWLGPSPARYGALACVAIGRVDAADAREFRAETAPEVALAAYRRHGHAFVERLRSELAFALWDGEHLTLGRDAFGVESMFLRGDAFASDPSLFPPSGRVDRLRVAELLSNARLDASHTFDEAIRELPPGCVWRAGRFTRWFDLDVPEDLRPTDQLVDDIRQTLTRAIDRRRPTGPVTVALSGGIDSSAIAATLRDQHPPVHTVSARWRHPAADEHRHLTRLLATGGFSTTVVDADDIDPFDPAHAAIAGPEATPFGASTLAMLRGAIGTVFFGYDADNIVSLGFESIADRLRRGDLTSTWHETRAIARSFGVTPLRLFRECAWPLLRPTSIIHELPSWISARLIRDVDLRGRVRQRRRPRTQREDHRFALEDADGRDLRALRHLAQAAGVDARFPFMDVDLARLFLGIPAKHRLGAGFERILYRRALAGLIPDDLRWRRSKANMIVAITEAIHRHLPPLDAEPLSEFVDVDAARRLHARFREAPTDEDAASIWSILTLASWLRRRN
jgi:asparagine synthase (glutamine-hydrolysing)